MAALLPREVETVYFILHATVCLLHGDFACGFVCICVTPKQITMIYIWVFVPDKQKIGICQFPHKVHLFGLGGGGACLLGYNLL